MSGQEPSTSSAYREVAGRLAEVIRGVGLHAERLLMDADEEAERVLREARAEAARVSSDAREEADRVMSRLESRRDAMIRHIRLLDDQLLRATSEVEDMIETMGSEGEDRVASSDTVARPEEVDSPLVIPEHDEANGELSVYMALWDLDKEAIRSKEANRPEDSAKR